MRVVAYLTSLLLQCTPANTHLWAFLPPKHNPLILFLGKLRYEPLFEYNKVSAANLEWFYHLTGGVTWTDFFAMRSTDYSKAGEGEDWGDIF